MELVLITWDDASALELYGQNTVYISSSTLKGLDMFNRERTPTYRSWESMRGRCNTPTHTGYYKYGGRGIKVCERWASFANFLEDMGERPAGATLDRIDVNGNYEPSNCRWATPSEQARNRRSTHYIEHDGKRLAIIDWAAITGIPEKTLYYRIGHGWDVTSALTLPLGSRFKPYAKATPEQIAKRLGRGKGVPLSEEHRRKLSLSHMGHVPTEETRRKLSAYNAGRPWSPARRAAFERSKSACPSPS